MTKQVAAAGKTKIILKPSKTGLKKLKKKAKGPKTGNAQGPHGAHIHPHRWRRQH